jgi:light-regulated signal transduction histidine kinase (bacteriophytochrome)
LKTAEQIQAFVEMINAYIAAKEAPLSYERINVKEITKGIRGEFSTALKSRRINWSEPDTFPEITADRLAITRVLRNVVDNALKYGGKELGEIKIGYMDNKAYHIFFLSDDGIGIKGEDKEKVFGIFQREGTSKGTTGSGLGLAIVREIAARHRGQAWIDTGTPKGATFYISISKGLRCKGS